MRVSCGGTLRLVVTLAIGLAAANAVQSTTGEAVILSTERKIKRVYESASPAIVRIVRLSEKQEEQLGSGVIVTSDGYVVTRGEIIKSNPHGSSLSVYLPGGRRVKVSVLGWSGEWNIGVLKLKNDGPWQHVPLGDKSANIHADQFCVALGYPNYGYDDPRPALRFGCITKSAGQTWLTSSCPIWMGDFGAGLFDLDGRLLGVCAEIPLEDDALYTAVDIIKEHWDSLIAGKNLDELRLSLTNDPIPLPSNDLAREERPTSGADGAAPGLERAAAATVRILPNTRNAGEGENWGWSGVIITPNGYVATCAHHKRLPGADVTIRLPDGRSAPGRVLGVNRLTDVGLVKLQGDGPWPYADIGNSTSISNSDSCTIMGYPHSHKDNQPLMRKTHIVPDPNGTDVRISSRISTARTASCEMTGGDSGGGLFDNQGRLIAVHEVLVPFHEHVRVEWFRRQWEFLVAGESVGEISTEPVTAFAQAFHRIAENNVAMTVVEIVRNNGPQALGIIVGADGQILTKASELYGDISCRTGDGKIHQATIVNIDRERDLALIQVDVGGLPVAKWSQSEAISVGTLVAAILPSQKVHVGVVSQSVRAISAEKGFMGRLRDSERGLELYDDSAQNYNLPLRKNDLILRVEGRPTPDLLTYSRLLTPNDGVPLAIAGDPVSVTIQRGGKTLDLRFPMAPQTWPRPWGQSESRRYSGFPSVLDTDVPLATTQCGAPLVDATGNVAAIAIACRTRGRTHIIPGAIARRFISNWIQSSSPSPK